MKEILDLLRDVVINPLLNRKKDQLAFITAQLKDAIDLDPQACKYLKSKKESLLLEIGFRTAGPSELTRQMLAISEYSVEGGIEWQTLQYSRPYLALGKQGRPIVVIKKTQRAEGIFSVILVWIVLCLLIFSALYGYLSSNPKIKASYLALSLICFGVIWLMLRFANPMGNINAARRVDRYLKSETRLLRFVHEVIQQIPVLKHVYEEHRRAYDEVIPYVIMDEFSNRAINDLRSNNESEVFHKFVNMLENRIDADDEVSNMIRTSFCETVDSHWADKELHDLLMENLGDSMKKWLTVR